MWVMVSLIALPGLLNWAAMRWHAARQRLRKGSNIRIWHNLHQGSRLRKFGGRVVPYSGGMLITTTVTKLQMKNKKCFSFTK